MLIPDNVIKDRLKNVYFIWGTGKTTIANRLREKHGYYVYDVDESRNRQMLLARPDHIESFNAIKARKDITEEEKNAIIHNAYDAVGGNREVEALCELPEWVSRLEVKNIVWDDNITVEQTVTEVEEYFWGKNNRG